MSVTQQTVAMRPLRVQAHLDHTLVNVTLDFRAMGKPAWTWMNAKQGITLVMSTPLVTTQRVLTGVIVAKGTAVMDNRVLTLMSAA